MRGSPQVNEKGGHDYGIIPAHAGLTHLDPHRDESLWDHPRACGAHTFFSFQLPPIKGSSPRMRGSRMYRCVDRLTRGIIPAHAGLTGLRLRVSTCRKDHPRACGAHCDVTAFIRLSLGSSPRMRGSPWHISVDGADVGIIPAHAGLTRSVSCPS